METFWDLVFMRVGESVEVTETYDDFDDVRADYKYHTEEHPEEVKYVVMRKITTDYAKEEEIEILDEWHNEKE